MSEESIANMRAGIARRREERAAQGLPYRARRADIGPMVEQHRANISAGLRRRNEANQAQGQAAPQTAIPFDWRELVAQNIARNVIPGLVIPGGKGKGRGRGRG